MNIRLSREIDSLMNVMQTQINMAVGSAMNDRVLPETQNIKGSLLLHQMVLGRIRLQVSKVSVMYGKPRIQNLQRRTQGWLRVILGKTRTLHLTEWQ